MVNEVEMNRETWIDKLLWATIWLLFLGLFLLGFAYWISYADAHDFYSNACCSGQDCHPVECDELINGKDLSINWHKYNFTKDQIKASEDKRCHVCIHDYIGFGTANYSKPMCVYILTGE